MTIARGGGSPEQSAPGAARWGTGREQDREGQGDATKLTRGSRMAVARRRRLVTGSGGEAASVHADGTERGLLASKSSGMGSPRPCDGSGDG